MKAGFIGLGGMGQVMANRLLEGGHDVGVYNRTVDKARGLVEAGAKMMNSVADAAKYAGCVFTMLADDPAVMEVATGKDGLIDSLPVGGIHICAGTHSVGAVQQLTSLHANAGQVLIAAPVLGRPEVVASGQAGIVVGGPAESVGRVRPLFESITHRIFEAGAEPVAAAAIKIAHNFVLGCAIESLGEGFALVRKYKVMPSVFNDVLTGGLFSCSAYKTYGKLISEERYLPAGHRVVMGLKDCNLAMAAAEAAGVPLPSGNVWRDRLIGAIAHGESDHDWSAMARDQARASGLE